jgi:hypothetical protein
VRDAARRHDPLVPRLAPGASGRRRAGPTDERVAKRRSRGRAAGGPRASHTERDARDRAAGQRRPSGAATSENQRTVEPKRWACLIVAARPHPVTRLGDPPCTAGGYRP